MNFLKALRFSDKTWFFIVVGVLILTLLSVIDYNFLTQGSFKDVLIGIHGLFFDIILFGIILSIYETLLEDKANIKRYLEEIDDFRGWHEDEAAFRVAGILRRLESHKVLDINLNGLNLAKTDIRTIERCKQTLSAASFKLAELKKLDLSNANLQGAQMYGCYLRKSNLQESKLNHAILTNSNLMGVNLSNANLSNADFHNCILRGAILTGAKLKNTNLRGVDLVGANLVDADLTGTKVYAEQIEDVKLAGGDTSKLFIVPLIEKKS